MSTIAVNAQDGGNDFAPPPLRTVSKDEKTRLNDESDVKSRTKLALSLMSDHLAEAERSYTTQDYERLFHALGGFQGLLDNTMDFLVHHDTNSGKVLDNLKRLEIGLRVFTPRLEAIRRELPLKYEEYVRNLMNYVRDSRDRAIEPLFGNTVVPIRKTN